MRVAVMFRRPTENDGAQDKRQRVFLFGSEDENLPARRLALAIHLARRRT